MSYPSLQSDLVRVILGGSRLPSHELFALRGLIKISPLLVLLVGCGSDTPTTTAQNSPADDSQLPLSPDAPVTDPQSGESPIGGFPDSDGNAGPEGNSGITINAQRYPLDAALGDIWGVENVHYNVNFTLTDGNFEIVPTEVDGVLHDLLVPAQATAVFYAQLFSAGTSFAYTSYSYSADVPESMLEGTGFFNDAFVGIDLNGNGRVDDAEKSPVLDGTIEFSGALPDIALSFSVALGSGESAVGHYSGLFDFTDRQ